MGSLLIGLVLMAAGLWAISYDRLLCRWAWLSERMPPGTPVPPRRVTFYKFQRVSRGYFLLALGLLFLLEALLR
ncbi:MAG: hypothetical protein M3P04_06685 [Actinomycetota bacterium]|nr:hypothetical protein [Actinomycetota bacterium]